MSEQAKRWWARISYGGPDAQGRRDYGGWVPTPETDRKEAEWYLRHVWGLQGGLIMEWMQL